MSEPKNPYPDGGQSRYERAPYYTETRNPSGSLVPQPKVFAGVSGGSVAALVAVVIAHQFPDTPPEVITAYSSLLIIALSFAMAYLVPNDR